MSEQVKETQIALESGTYDTRLTRKYALRKPYAKPDPRVIKAVIPGSVAEIATRIGAQVKRGDILLILEAMKMLNRIRAPQDGTVKAIQVATGEKVMKGQILLEIE